MERKGADEKDLLSFTISRLMLPDDANNAGNVHGGTILKMVEESGAIVATRWCNLLKKSTPEDDKKASNALLVRIEHMDFLHPVHIGQVAHVVATIKYTSAHSLLVEAKASGEDIVSGCKKVTNVARLWYVPVDIEPPYSIQSVPAMTPTNPEEEAEGKAAYETQKKERQAPSSQNGGRIRTFSLSAPIDGEPEPLTSAYTRTVLSHLVGVSDVSLGGFCKGGVMLKLIDECGAIAAVKHCQNSVVTACIETTNFHDRVPKGALISIKSQVIFTSQSSMQTEVVVEYELPLGSAKSRKKIRAIDAYFTYVSINSDKKVEKVPQLKITTSEEKEQYDAAKNRYEKRKSQRMAEKQTSSAN